MKRLNRKLKELEKNVISEIPNVEESFLLIKNDIEQQLHDRADTILKRQLSRLDAAQKVLETGSEVNVNNFADISPDEDTIVSKSRSLIRQRVMQLFDVAVGSYIHLNDPTGKWIFQARLYWFLKEMSDWLFLLWTENQIMSAPDFFTLCSGEQERLLKPVYDKWRDWLFPASWEKYCAEHKPKFRNYEELTPEEKTELERDAENEEKEEAERSEQEKLFLRDKCPDCTNKCRWYNEQTGERNEI